MALLAVFTVFCSESSAIVVSISCRRPRPLTIRAAKRQRGPVVCHCFLCSCIRYRAKEIFMTTRRRLAALPNRYGLNPFDTGSLPSFYRCASVREVGPLCRDAGRKSGGGGVLLFHLRMSRLDLRAASYSSARLIQRSASTRRPRRSATSAGHNLARNRGSAVLARNPSSRRIAAAGRVRTTASAARSRSRASVTPKVRSRLRLANKTACG
jgi:hypothetical protein